MGYLLGDEGMVDEGWGCGVWGCIERGVIGESCWGCVRCSIDSRRELMENWTKHSLSLVRWADMGRVWDVTVLEESEGC